MTTQEHLLLELMELFLDYNMNTTYKKEETKTFNYYSIFNNLSIKKDLKKKKQKLKDSTRKH